MHARTKEQARPNRDVRKWYYTARWRQLRTEVLNANPLCVVCQRVDCTVMATEIDHILPHRGSSALFWDRRNLQGLCHPHHGEKTGHGG